MFRENENVNIKHMLFTVITKEFAEEEMCIYLLLGQDI